MTLYNASNLQSRTDPFVTARKLSPSQLDLIKKGLRAQSEGMMTMMTGHCSSLIQAQMQLVELLPDKTTTDATGDGRLYVSVSALWLTSAF